MEPSLDKSSPNLQLMPMGPYAQHKSYIANVSSFVSLTRNRQEVLFPPYVKNILMQVKQI